MTQVGCTRAIAVAIVVAAATNAHAQANVPPPTGFEAPPPTSTPPPAPADTAPPTAPAATSVAPATASVAPATTASVAPTASTTEATAAGAAEVSTGPSEADLLFGEDAGQKSEEEEWKVRRETLALNNGLLGPTALLRVQPAQSGAVGTFRIAFITGYYKGSGFLCDSSHPCTRPSGVTASEDSAESVSADTTISATPLSYLEAYLGLHSQAASNNFGTPKLLQVVGDTNLGVKAFMPSGDDRIFSAGGSADLWLLNSAGSIAIGTANIAFRGLVTADLTRRSQVDRRIPLRFHANLGYLFDNSGGLVDDTEASRGGERISRVERFGLDVNRVDSILFGLGAEYVHEVVQPFVEWTLDIPNNRQNYVCVVDARAPGDDCLGNSSGLSSMPSRLTLGTRVTAGLPGLSGLLALDIGTGGTSHFIEEVAPEVPWKLYVGLGFAYDVLTITHPPVREVVVEKPPPPPSPKYRIIGLVVDDKSEQPIADAIVRFKDQPLTGMATRSDGSFETVDLTPGDYTFSVTADGYEPGTCQVAVAAHAAPPRGAEQSAFQETSPAAPNPEATPGVQPEPAASSVASPESASSAPIVTNVACTLKALPRVGTIVGSLVNAETGKAVAGAKVRVRDSRGRELQLQADDEGRFRFENVLAGSVELMVESSEYLPASTALEMAPRQEEHTTIVLNPRPKRSSVVVTPKEVKLNKQIHFVYDSAEILPDSMSIIQEIALTLNEHSELSRIEIQGHTDNTGTEQYNMRLSQQRADAVKASLVQLGIDPSRLTAVGYGQERPLVPNTSGRNRAVNRRVQLIILQRD